MDPKSQKGGEEGNQAMEQNFTSLTDGGREVMVKNRVGDEAEEKAALPNTRIANQ